MSASVPFNEIKAAFLADPLALIKKVPGLWLVDKPSGPTSHDVVAALRRFLNLRRVGHAGTLDPLASGLLIIMAGNASRLFDLIQTFPKTYHAAFRLGQRTDSQDSTGAPLADWKPLLKPPVAREKVVAALSRFVGEIEQVPPMHSALKKNGVPLYKLARRGEVVERAPRRAVVYDAAVEEFDGTSGRLVLTVSSGFYVRTLIDDLGGALGCGAVMTGLRRTAIGPFTVQAAENFASFPTKRKSAEKSSPAESANTEPSREI